MNSQVEQRVREHLQRRATSQIPPGIEERIYRRVMSGSPPTSSPRWWLQVAGAVAILVLALGIGLVIQYGRSHPAPAKHSTIVSPSPSAPPPAGGPAPAALIGQWVPTTDPRTIGGAPQRLVIRATSWIDGAVHGDLVVNGDEIDFYNSDYCHLRLPDGVGRYRWSITADLLTLTLLAPDPCRPGGGGMTADPFRKAANGG